MIFAPATSTAIGFRAVAVAGLSSDFRGVGPVNLPECPPKRGQPSCNGGLHQCGPELISGHSFYLRVAQRLERTYDKTSVPTAGGLNAIKSGTDRCTYCEVDGSSPSPQVAAAEIVHSAAAAQFPASEIRGAQS